MGAKNRVVKGDYLNEIIFKELFVNQISIGFGGKIKISKNNIKQYEIIDEEKRKSVSSTIIRGTLGFALLGGVGALAGLSAKSKGIYLVAIEFNDGKRSLLEIDEKLYKVFIQSMF